MMNSTLRFLDETAWLYWVKREETREIKLFASVELSQGWKESTLKQRETWRRLLGSDAKGELMRRSMRSVVVL